MYIYLLYIYWLLCVADKIVCGAAVHVYTYIQVALPVYTCIQVYLHMYYAVHIHSTMYIAARLVLVYTLVQVYTCIYIYNTLWHGGFRVSLFISPAPRGKGGCEN